MISLAPLGAPGNGDGSQRHSTTGSGSSARLVELQLLDAIVDVCKEWSKLGCKEPKSRVLDSASPGARALLMALDRFMSNGCLRGDRLYWNFAREFLTRNERQNLMDEWKAENERQLSVAWLKDSLNKQTICSIFQSIVLNWKIVLKYYNCNAIIANRALTKRIANKLFDICAVKFAFLSPSSTKMDDIPVAEIRSPAAPITPSSMTAVPESVAVACVRQSVNGLVPGAASGTGSGTSSGTVSGRTSRRRRTTRSESTIRAIGDVPLPPDFVETTPVVYDAPYISSAKDYDYVFDQMLRRDQRGIVACGSLPLITSSMSGSTNTSNTNINNNNININNININNNNNNKISNIHRIKHQRSYDGERRTISDTVRDEKRRQNRIKEGQSSSVEEVQNPFDLALKNSISKAKLLAAAREVELKTSSSNTQIQTTEFTPFGEMRLDMGEVVGLSIKVFRDEMEKFLKFYQVFVHFGTGQPDRRYLVLSNRAIYLLSLQCNLATGKKTYITCAYLSLADIDCIEIGFDYEVVYLNVKKGTYMEGTDGEKLGDSQMEICTACEQLGQSMVEAICRAYEDYLQQKLPAFTDGIANRLITSRFIAKELKMESPTLECYCLAQWRQTASESTLNEKMVQRSGFLYYRVTKTNLWLSSNANATFNQSFFHLYGKKLYQFEDSTCKVGQRVISIQESVTNVLELKGNEQTPHMFQLELLNGERYEFICASASDLHKWVSLLNFALSTTDMDDEAVACIAMISNEQWILLAQEGVNCLVDGFMRLLQRIEIATIRSIVGVMGNERYACVINNASGGCMDWVFLRSPDQMDRFLAALQKLGVNRESNEEEGSSRLTALLNSMPRSGDLFYFSDAHTDDAFDL